MNQKVFLPYILLIAFSVVVDILALELLFIISGPGIWASLGSGAELKGTILLFCVALQFVALGVLGFFLAKRKS